MMQKTKNFEQFIALVYAALTIFKILDKKYRLHTSRTDHNPLLLLELCMSFLFLDFEAFGVFFISLD